MNENAKICKRADCKKTVKGRSDRLFCCSYCKSEHHYAIRKSSGKTYFKLQVDEILRKNRAILEKFNTKNGVIVSHEVLEEAGFTPRFFTHYWSNLSGETFYFCYDQGFCEMKSQLGKRYKLAQWQKEMERQIKL